MTRLAFRALALRRSLRRSKRQLFKPFTTIISSFDTLIVQVLIIVNFIIIKKEKKLTVTRMREE